MSDNNRTIFENHLDEIDENGWLAELDNLLPSIHEVDWIATQVWFRFYPLALYRYLEHAEDFDTAIQGFTMQGDYELKTQIDKSHRFLYGHRYWPDVKRAITKRAESYADKTFDLSREIESLTESAQQFAKCDKSLLIGITAIGLMTLVQTGLDAFRELLARFLSFSLLILPR